MIVTEINPQIGSGDIMRLWHQQLIPLLPRQQLLGQHRECCALRGKGWGKKHKTVNYVFKYSPARLYMYHLIVMKEMKRRGYNPAEVWFDLNYRGKQCTPYKLPKIREKYKQLQDKKDENIYPEHDEIYLQECIENLQEKGVTCRCFAER